jgi:hypothetical protein
MSKKGILFFNINFNLKQANIIMYIPPTGGNFETAYAKFRGGG